MAKSTNFAVKCNCNIKLSQNIQKIFLKVDGFLGKNMNFFVKWLKIANLPKNWLSYSGFSKHSNLGFLQKKMAFLKKTLKLSKLADGSNFSVECNWICQISRNVQKFLAF